MDELLYRITIITRRENTEILREGLCNLGINGLTVTMVEGCGVQKTVVRYFRGGKIEVRLMPKVMFEVVVSEELKDSIVNTACTLLRTGEIGDGKIFIEEEENVYTIRTKKSGIH